MKRFKTPFLGIINDAEVEAKLKWLISRLPMSRDQVMKKALLRYFSYHYERYYPSYNQLKGQLLHDQKGECYYCHKLIPYKDGTIDHKLPLYRGGKNERENMCIACYSCNQMKGRMTEEEYAGLMDEMKTTLESIKNQAPPIGYPIHATS